MTMSCGQWPTCVRWHSPSSRVIVTQLVTRFMPSLEDRYWYFRVNVLRRKHWSRKSDDLLLTVNALGSSRHLARAWPTDRPLRRSFRMRTSTAAFLVRAGFLVVWAIAMSLISSHFGHAAGTPCISSAARTGGPQSPPGYRRSVLSCRICCWPSRSQSRGCGRGRRRR